MSGLHKRKLAILGSTGSVGRQALEVASCHQQRVSVFALAAHTSTATLAEQARRFRPRCVAIGDRSHAPALKRELEGSGIEVLGGMDGVCETAAAPEVDTVVAAMSGLAGLRPVLAAIREGKRVALANKETLVAAGRLVMELARKHGARILPVDSEHSAIIQCLEPGMAIHEVVLTASGGPFLHRDPATFGSITPAEALRHPNWAMGPKNTVDSATMMNKGLEVIEACNLFGLSPRDVRVVIHPQSIVHSMVTFKDGSTKAQLSTPDMRLPIQFAISCPDRWDSPFGHVNWEKMHELQFFQPDLDQFPSLRLAYAACSMGSAAPVVLNAANEEAVGLFLRERLTFTGMFRVVTDAVEALGHGEADACEDILEVDAAARRLVRGMIA